MTSVIKPEITSIINGLLTLTVRSVTAVEALFNELHVYRSDAANGSFTQIATVPLAGATSYTFLDINAGPGRYYKAQFFHNTSMVTSQFSELAQETGVFSEYTVPVSTASYPPEIALSEQDREIVESVRVTIGDLGSVERDSYDSSDPNSALACSEQISGDLCTWELREPRGWPRDVKLNGEFKTSLNDPQVLGYRYLTFSGGSSCISGTLDIFYNSFRFSDREILLAYDRAKNLLVSCGLTDEQITTEMLIMQASILLLEGELRQANERAVFIQDGDTRYDNSRNISSRTEDLQDLKNKIKDLIDCARHNASYDLEGVRIN